MQQGSALLSPGESALRFFTDFSNPDNAAYAWNSAQSRADAAFVAGKLAMYIGQASEYRSLREQNPHLALDVAQMPQIRDGATFATYADMFGFAILQSSKNPQAACQAILLLTNQAAAASVSGQSGLPPMRKDLLRQDPADPVQSVFWRAAIQSRAWLDPRPDTATTLFADAVRAVNSGAKSANRAASDLVS